MDQIEQKVLMLKQLHGTSDPFALCREMGIVVTFPRLPYHVKGFMNEIEGKQIVYINRDLGECEQRVICGHELGHALLHKQVNTLFISYHTNLLCARYEREADYFCACLLLENDYFAPDFGFSTLEQIAAYSGVNIKLVEMRAEAMKLTN